MAKVQPTESIIKNKGWQTNDEKCVRAKFSIILFACSILVIFIHAFNLETYGITETSTAFAKCVYIIETYWASITKIAVPMFFMISGILFFKTFEISSLLQKWKKRVSTILIPYIIWCTLYYVYYLIVTHLPIIRSMMNNTDIVELSIKEWFSWLWVNEYYTLWFLQNLIVFILLSPVIWFLLKNHFKKVPTGLIALISILFVKIKFGNDIPYSTGLEVYLIGSYIGLNCRNLIQKKNRVISIISLLYVIFMLVTSLKIWNIITESLLFIAIWYAIDLFDFTTVNIPWWMKITFFSYVAHDIFLESFEKIFLKVFGVNSVFALLDYIFIPVLVEIVLIGIAFVMKKKLPLIWKVITGGR